MIINSVHIEKFRALEDVTIPLGERVTAIVGQNGTLKSTILGIIAQPFSLEKSKVLSGFRGLDGSQLQSKLSDKFKMSLKEGLVDYVWTINFTDKDTPPHTVKGEERKDSPYYRFWKVRLNEKGDYVSVRDVDSGYAQHPVTLLTLKRLTPLGEEKSIRPKELELSEEEIAYYKRWHNDILSISDEIHDVSNIVSRGKNTLAPQTEAYDPMSISAGQDNIGKIIMSILSFKRMKNEYPDDYNGGLLLIDEIDSTLFPSAQKRLIDFLFKSAKEDKIQIVFTTHSLSAIEGVYAALEENYNRYYGKVVALQKVNGRVVVRPKNDYSSLLHHLNITVPATGLDVSAKIRVYCEDPEAVWFAKKMLHGWTRKVKWMIGMTLGCGNYKNLIEHNIPEFLKNIIILDGDAMLNKEGRKTAFPKKAPVIELPGESMSPEQLFYGFLKGLDEEDDFWTQGPAEYDKQHCFIEHQGERPQNREQYKDWFTSQMKYWGSGGSRLYQKWVKSSDENQKIVADFRDAFNKLHHHLTGRYLEEK